MWWSRFPAVARGCRRPCTNLAPGSAYADGTDDEHSCSSRRTQLLVLFVVMSLSPLLQPGARGSVDDTAAVVVVAVVVAVVDTVLVGPQPSLDGGRSWHDGADVGSSAGVLTPASKQPNQVQRFPILARHCSAARAAGFPPSH